MAEIVKHALGFCGEHWHPNIWTLLTGGFGLVSIYYYIVSYLKCRYNKFKTAFAYTLNNTWQKLINYLSWQKMSQCPYQEGWTPQLYYSDVYQSMTM